MLNDSFAPMKRALLFFGVMGVGVAALTMGAGFQAPSDQSSTTVAQAKIERHESSDSRFAAVKPAQRQASPAKRAIASSQQALFDASPKAVMR